MHEKYEALLAVLKPYKKIGVCLSGGSSSALVAIAARQALGRENVVAITADTPFFTGAEMASSKDLTKKIGIKLLAPKADLLESKDVVANEGDRCYLCKKIMMDTVRKASAGVVDVLFDGTPYDGDKNEKVEKKLDKLGIICPLREAKITREDVQDILKELGMGYYIQPENACLATRIAAGEPITLKKLRWIRAAENFIHSLGFDLVRVRLANGDARIEVLKADVPMLLEQKEMIEQELLVMGFKNVAFAEEGYIREEASCL